MNTNTNTNKNTNTNTNTYINTNTNTGYEYKYDYECKSEYNPNTNTNLIHECKYESEYELWTGVIYKSCLHVCKGIACVMALIGLSGQEFGIMCR